MAATKDRKPGDGDVRVGHTTLQVPAKYVERFRHETLSVLGSAAQVIEEVARWSREAIERDKPPKREITARDLQTFHDAELLFVEARVETDRVLTVEARATALHSAAVGCLLDAAEAIKAEADNRTSDFAPVLEEFDFWRGLVERLDGEIPLPDGWHKIDEEQS